MSECTLLEVNREITALKQEYNEHKMNFDKYTHDYKNKIKYLEDKLRLLQHNIDVRKIERGKALLLLQFPYNSNEHITYPIYESLIVAAQDDLISGCKILKNQYIGQKRYEGFDQRSDHKYGYGPKHGYIYQRIGLKHPECDLSDDDIECCLYLLSNIDVIVENLNK